MLSKKFMQKMVLITLVGGLATNALVGCSSKESTPTGNQATSGEKAEGDKQSTDKVEEVKLEGSLITEKPTTFKIFSLFNGMPFDPEWPVFKEIAANTNISLSSIIPKSTSDELSAYNLMISSGELADIVCYSSISDLEKLGRDGGLIPLNDLIDEHAPNIKKQLEENEVFRKTAYSADGMIYQVPKVQTTEVAEGFFIRTDWLEKLGLETPKTMDEVYTVLKAFREQDPNGNGVKDEVPYFDRAGNKMFDDVLYMWDASTEFYCRDGKMTYGPLEDEFQYAMKEVSKWYKEGLIDPEIFTRGPQSRDILLGGDLGGMTHDWMGSTADYNYKLVEMIEGFEFMPMAPPANQKGEMKERTTRGGVPGWGISSQCKDPVTVIKFFDYIFSEEGHKLMNFGVEGLTYNMVDGKPVYTDAIMKAEKTPLAALRSYGVQYRIGMLQDYGYEEAWLTDIAKQGDKMYADGGWVSSPVPYFDGILGLKFTGEQEAEYKKIMNDIKPYVDEMVQKWVLGSSNFEAEYPKFVETLEKKGISRALEIAQEAYEFYISQ